MPEGFELEYLVYSLSNGDPAHERYILDHWTMEDLTRHISFREYDRFNLEKSMRR